MRRGDICVTDVAQGVSEIQLIAPSFLCCVSSVPEVTMKGDICGVGEIECNQDAFPRGGLF